MPSYEGLRLKVNKYLRNKNHIKWYNELSNRDFTIISNNCWGGMIYESYGMRKLSPTVGMFFLADDYIRFVCDLKTYVNQPLTMIEPHNSKYYDILSADRPVDYPIGKIGDVEMMFLHYKSNEEAIEKWNRRVDRINWDNLLIKFNDNNGCTEKNK